MLAQANEEAARILQMARQKGDALLDQESTVQAAMQRAQMILDQARQESENITREADQYVMQVLSQLENSLLKNLNVVRNGINELKDAEQPQFAQPNQARLNAPQVRQTVDVENRSEG